MQNTIETTANNIAKRGKELSKQIKALLQERATLQTQYETIIEEASRDTLNEIEAALKNKFPKSKIQNSKGIISIKLRKENYIYAFPCAPTVFYLNALNRLKNEIAEITELHSNVFKFTEVEIAFGVIKAFNVVLTQSYKKSNLNLPIWNEAMKRSK